MNQQVHFITVGVADLDVSRQFYSDGLGWTPMLDMPGTIAFYQLAPGLLFGIFPYDDFTHDVTAPMGPGPSFALAQNVDSEAEVDARYHRALGAGATSLKPPQHASFGGYHAYVADPDGHRWEIAHNPGWSVGDDGTVRFG